MIYYVKEEPIRICINRTFVSGMLFVILSFSICFFVLSYLEQQNIIETYDKKVKTLTADLEKSTLVLKQLSIKETREHNQVEKMNTEIHTLQAKISQENNIIKSEKEKINKYENVLKGVMSTSYYKIREFLHENIKNYPDIYLENDQFFFNQKVYFSPGSVRLSKDDQETLNRLAVTLQRLEATIPQTINWVVRIEGHTDDKPIHTDLYPSNWYLSTARAAKVIEYLVKKGIPSKRLIAMGQADGVTSADYSAEGRSQNRSVKFILA